MLGNKTSIIFLTIVDFYIYLFFAFKKGNYFKFFSQIFTTIGKQFNLRIDKTTKNNKMYAFS